MARKTVCDFCGKEIDVVVKTLNGVDFVLMRSHRPDNVLAAFDACPDCLQKVIQVIDDMFLKEEKS